VASEISGITAKATPVGGDFLLIEDSAAANIKKSMTVSALEAIVDHGNIAGLTDDDHAQYYLADGTRAISGDLNHDGSNIGFFAKAPVAQPAASANLTDSSGGTANDTVQALTDPADTPATADALRDDLVANLIPELRNNYADLTAKINDVLTALRNLGLIAT